MTDITDDEAKALVSVLMLAENHQMWADRLSRSPLFKDFVAEQYEHIQTVRAFLDRNNIMTLHGLTTLLSRDLHDIKKSG